MRNLEQSSKVKEQGLPITHVRNNKTVGDSSNRGVQRLGDPSSAPSSPDSLGKRGIMKRKEQKGTVEKVNPRESEGRNLIYNFGSGVRRAGCRAWGPSWHPSGRATPTKQATRTIKLRATCMCTRVSPQEPMSRRLSAMGAFQGIRIKFHSS